MKKIYCAICWKKNRKFKNRKILYISKKTVPSIICSKSDIEDEKLFKEEKSVEMLKILGLIRSIYLL